jgi:hypothetical protein
MNQTEQDRSDGYLMVGTHSFKWQSRMHVLFHGRAGACILQVIDLPRCGKNLEANVSNLVGDSEEILYLDTIVLLLNTRMSRGVHGSWD